MGNLAPFTTLPIDRPEHRQGKVRTASRETHTRALTFTVPLHAPASDRFRASPIACTYRRDRGVIAGLCSNDGFLRKGGLFQRLGKMHFCATDVHFLIILND
jgi:hypothetical protein